MATEPASPERATPEPASPQRATPAPATPAPATPETATPADATWAGTRRSLAGRLAVAVLQLPIRAYRLVLSPWVGMHCRFQPTCSAYALEALERHGPIRGLWLTLRRLSRCHPGGGDGFDPVPPRPAATRPAATHPAATRPAATRPATTRDASTHGNAPPAP